MKKVFISVLFFLVVFSLSAQLNGVYTINSAAPTKKTNFKTLSDALEALKYQDLEADVTFKLSPGFYNQPLVFEGIQSELGFKVTFTNDTEETVEFVNDGISLMVANSSNIVISNIKFSAISTEMSSMVILNNSNNITVTNNEFMVGEMHASHKSLISLTNSSHDNFISNNTLRGASGVEIIRMSNENFVKDNDIYFTTVGVKISTSLNTQLVSNFLQGMGNGFMSGIVVDGVVGEMTIASNAILGVNEGISQELTYRPSASKFSGSIVNNIIESDGHTLNLNNNVSGLQIAFNSFISKKGSVLNFNDHFKASMSNINVFANNLINSESAALVMVSSTNIIGLVDYNNLYNQDGNFKTQIGLEVSTKLEDWKTKMNAENAISADPLFIAAGELKYTLSENSPCIDAGPDAYVIGVFKDYDGDRRGKVTEIGADEFNKLAFEQVLKQYQLAFK